MVALALAGPADAGISLSSNVVTVVSLGAGNFELLQNGWSNGGFISGSFLGNDDNGDFFIDSFEDEVTAFSMNFSGNSRIAAFSLGFDDLYGRAFRLDAGNTLGDGSQGDLDEGILVVGYSHIYGAGPGALGGALCGGSEPCALIANIPEPASWTMLIAGFGLVGAAMRRRSHWGSHRRSHRDNHRRAS